jgi:leucyl aminopeptidase
MSEPIIASSSRSSEDGAPTPIHCLYESELAAFVEARPSFVKGFVALEDFKAKAGQVLVLPTPQGAVDRVLLGLGQRVRPRPCCFAPCRASCRPATTAWRRRPTAWTPARSPWPSPWEPTSSIATSRARARTSRRLVADENVDLDEVHAVAHACALARDMVNTPANDMGPLQIETIAREIAERYGATLDVITGDDLLDQNYPAVHAVGRAAVEPARPACWRSPGAIAGIRAWRSSARAWCSTPAAWTSSRPAACG